MYIVRTAGCSFECATENEAAETMAVLEDAGYVNVTCEQVG
jgi:hypothetical protein